MYNYFGQVGISRAQLGIGFARASSNLARCASQASRQGMRLHAAQYSNDGRVVKAVPCYARFCIFSLSCTGAFAFGLLSMLWTCCGLRQWAPEHCVFEWVGPVQITFFRSDQIVPIRNPCTHWARYQHACHHRKLYWLFLHLLQRANVLLLFMTSNRLAPESQLPRCK